MVFQFIGSGRHEEFLHDLQEACRHTKALMGVHSTGGQPSALSSGDAARLHLEKDLESLTAWQAEISRLASRFSSIKPELEGMDRLKAGELGSCISRTMASLSAVLVVIPEALRHVEAHGSLQGWEGVADSLHRQLSGIQQSVNGMEKCVAAFKDLKETAPLPDESAPLALCFEASSFLSSQLRHGEVPLEDFHTALRKVEHFVRSGRTPTVSSHAEPHCFGSPPDHLNGVVVGRQERLIYFVEDRIGRPAVRLCCWISASMHKDAFSRLRHQNLYRRMMSKDPKEQVTRRFFDGFTSFDHQAVGGIHAV